MDMHFEYIKAKSFFSDLVKDLTSKIISGPNGKHNLTGYLVTLEDVVNGGGNWHRPFNTAESVRLHDMTLLRLELHIEVEGNTKVKHSAFITMTETKCIYNEYNVGKTRINENFPTWQLAFQRLLDWHGMPKKRV